MGTLVEASWREKKEGMLGSECAYDLMGRLTGLTHTHGQTTLADYDWTYDAASRITEMISPDGTDNYTLDDTDQLLTASRSGEDYDYDDNGNRTASGSTTWSTGPYNRLLSDGTYTYEYDNEGNRTKRTKTSDGSWIEYAWDHRNRLTGETFRNSSGTVTKVIQYTYDAFDRRIRKAVGCSQWANSVIDFSSQFSTGEWSAAQALGAPNVPAYADDLHAWAPLPKNGTTETLTLGYATPVFATGVTIHESCGNGFVTEVEVRNAATGEFETVWTGVDPSQPGSLVSFAVTFGRRSYLVDAVRITLDTDHNLATWEEIDAVELSGAVDCVYNVYQGDDAYLEVSDQDGLGGGTYSPSISHRYLYGQAVDQILASTNSSGTVLWGLGDHAGTIRDVVNSSGTSQNHLKLDAFGKPTDSTAPISDFLFGLEGRPWDADGEWWDFRARVYDPYAARFASEDPSGLTPDTNPYRSCDNNWLINSDPTGLCSGPISIVASDYTGLSTSTFGAPDPYASLNVDPFTAYWQEYASAGRRSLEAAHDRVWGAVRNANDISEDAVISLKDEGWAQTYYFTALPGFRWDVVTGQGRRNESKWRF